MKLTPSQLEAAFFDAVRGMARVQARQEMMECIIRAFIAEAPPARPLFAKALRTAKSDMELRSARAREWTAPELDADAMALWNELWRACAPPSEVGNES